VIYSDLDHLLPILSWLSIPPKSQSFTCQFFSLFFLRFFFIDRSINGWIKKNKEMVERSKCDILGICQYLITKHTQKITNIILVSYQLKFTYIILKLILQIKNLQIVLKFRLNSNFSPPTFPKLRFWPPKKENYKNVP